jgi:hypothetical protein
MRAQGRNTRAKASIAPTLIISEDAAFWEGRAMLAFALKTPKLQKEKQSR